MPFADTTAALASIREQSRHDCEVALILGSGLSGLAAAVTDAKRIPYSDIEGFPAATAPGHEGQLILGELHQQRVAILSGRPHLYEGWQPAQIALPIRTLRALGATVLAVTNAAGALNDQFEPGDVMLITDHMNFTGLNPLIGPNDDDVGLRFPDMSRAYDPHLRAATAKALEAEGISYREGIYAGVTGPSLETSAERRFLRAAGADAVGMSTVTEVIAAVHAGLRVVGLSAITNKATGGDDQQPDTIEDVHRHAAVAGEKIERALTKLLPRLPAIDGEEPH